MHDTDPNCHTTFTHESANVRVSIGNGHVTLDATCQPGEDIPPLERINRAYMLAVLMQAHGNRATAAARLGIGRATMYRHFPIGDKTQARSSAPVLGDGTAASSTGPQTLESLDTIIRRHLETALACSGGLRSAARAINIPYSSFRDLAEKHGLWPPPPPGESPPNTDVTAKSRIEPAPAEEEP
jgi:hypothetical protein